MIFDSHTPELTKLQASLPRPFVFLMHLLCRVDDIGDQKGNWHEVLGDKVV